MFHKMISIAEFIKRHCRTGWWKHKQTKKDDNKKCHQQWIIRLFFSACSHISRHVLIIAKIREIKKLWENRSLRAFDNYFFLQRLGHPDPLTRWFPAACHSCPHLLHSHQSFLPVPAHTLSEGSSFFGEYSLAKSGRVTTKLFVSVTTWFAHAGQPEPWIRDLQ